MSEGNPNQNNGEKVLEDFEINAELSSIADQRMLPLRIVQRIGEKIKEKNIRVTKSQLYKLIEKIQLALRMDVPPSSNQSEQGKKNENVSPLKGDKNPWSDATLYTMDMKKLVETVDRLGERLKKIEATQLEGIRGATAQVVKAKDMKSLESDELFTGDMQPLEQIPTNPESIVVLMKWLQYLVEKTGKNNLPDVLGYYVDIGWISDDVRLDLLEYSKGITEDQTSTGAHTAHLPTRDHLQSLLYIQKLKGIQLDDRFLSKIERDMEKMIKSLEGIQLK